MRFSFVFAVVFCFWAMPAQAEGMMLSFSKQYDVFPVEQGQEAKQDKSTVHVALFPDRFVVTQGRIEEIYDLPNMRRISVNHDEKQYSLTSLYARPIFMLRERQNRERMQKMLQAAMGDKAPEGESPVDIDMMFGTDAIQTTADNLVIHMDAGIKKYSYADKLFLHYALSDTAVPEGLRQSYKMYLIYRHSLHPKIRNDLAIEPRFVKKLWYAVDERVMRRETLMTLQQTERLTGKPPGIPDGYELVYDPNPDLNTAIQWGMENPMPPVEGFVQEAVSALEAGKKMTAALSILELTVMYDLEKQKNVVDQIKQVMQAAGQDKNVQQVLAAVTTTPKNATEYAAIRRILMETGVQQAPEKDYLLAMFAANHFISINNKQASHSQQDLQNRKKAILTLKRAITQNPWLTGAYVDLGNIYFKDYEVFKAWSYWNYARHLMPDHALLATVDQMEQKARRDFGEFFLTKN